MLYGHMACPGTARARTYLALCRLRYIWRGIHDAGVAAEFRALGAWATPAIILDGRLLMVGFDQAALEVALEAGDHRHAGGAGPGS